MTQIESEGTTSWNKLSLAVMSAGVVSLLAAGVLFVLSITGAVGDNGYSGPGTSIDIGGDIRDILTPQPTPTAERPPPSTAPVNRISIPRFGVDAAIVVLGVNDDGVMETPDGPTNVAWYDFSARPGYPADEDGGNAVFSGHVDYYNYGPAVFWNLRNLELDDEIEVGLADGTVYRYVVVSRNQYDAATAPIREIVGDTPNEVITLITCGGVFDPSVGEYNDRVVVRAQRIYEPAPSLEAQVSP